MEYVYHALHEILQDGERLLNPFRNIPERQIFLVGICCLCLAVFVRIFRWRLRERWLSMGLSAFYCYTLFCATVLGRVSGRRRIRLEPFWCIRAAFETGQWIYWYYIIGNILIFLPVGFFVERITWLLSPGWRRWKERREGRRRGERTEKDGGRRKGEEAARTGKGEERTGEKAERIGGGAERTGEGAARKIRERKPGRLAGSRKKQPGLFWRILCGLLRFAFSVGLCLALSCLIEGLQFFYGRGLCEFDDLFHNTLGGLIGYLISLVLSSAAREIRMAGKGNER